MTDDKLAKKITRTTVRPEPASAFCAEDGFPWPCRTEREVADLLDGDTDA